VVNVLQDLHPVAVDDAATTQQDTSVVIDVLDNDHAWQWPDEYRGDQDRADPRQRRGPDRPENSVHPTFGFFGEDTFEYRLTDVNGDLDVATVTVGVYFVSGQVAIDIMPNDAGNQSQLAIGTGPPAFDVAILSVGCISTPPAQIDPCL